MERRKVWCWCIGLLMGVLFILVTGVPQGWTKSYKKSFVISFQMSWHTKHPEYFAFVNPHKMLPQFSKEQGFIPMMEKAAEKLGYKVKFIIYPADQLVKRKIALEALKDGTIDMLASCAAYFHGLVPEGDVDWMPNTATIVGRGKTWDFLNSGEMAKIKRTAYEKKTNAVWITNVLAGSSCLMARGNKPFKTLEDLKGKKIRAAGGLATRIVDLLGASPVTMATGEIYPALQRGVLDGLMFYIYGLRDYMLIDYCKAVTYPAIYVWNDEIWVNKDKFDSFPPDLKKAFMDTAHKWARWASTQYWPAYEKSLEEWAKKRGVVFYYLPSQELKRWDKAIAPVWDWYAHESPLCAQEVKLFKEFLKENSPK